MSPMEESADCRRDSGGSYNDRPASVVVVETGIRWDHSKDTESCIIDQDSIEKNVEMLLPASVLI